MTGIPPAGAPGVHTSAGDADDVAPERSINHMMESIPVGPFHHRLLGICGLSFMADAMEVSLLSFMAPCVGLDWGLADSEVAGIASMVFAGILLGSLFWGPVADMYGRRLSYLWGALLIIVGGIVSAFCQSYASLIVLRAIVGFGVGGISVPFDLLAEYTPSSHRGQYLMYIEYFWTLGSVFVAASAWVFLSAFDWRVLTLVTAAPVTVGLTWSICYLPESPRWLLQRGRVEEAQRCVEAMAATNGQPLPPFRLRAPRGVAAGLDDSRSSAGSADGLNPSGQPDCEGRVSITDFLKRDQLGLTLPLWMVWFSFGFAYYGIVLFVAKVFEVDNGDSAERGESCRFTYGDIFVSAVSEVLGVTVTALIIDRLGRVKTQGLLYGVAGVAVLFLGMPIDMHFRTVMSVLGRSAAMGAASATWVATPELYSTHTRATAHAIANSISHFGGFLVPYLIDGATVPAAGAVLALMNFAGLASVQFLPETLGVELDKSARGQPEPALAAIELSCGAVSAKGRVNLAVDSPFSP